MENLAGYLNLSYKLWFYTRISSPEKSHNITGEKIQYFLQCVWYCRLAMPFVLPFSVQGCLSEFFQIVAAKTLKNLFRWQTVTLKLSYKGKKQNVKRKTKSYVFSGFGNEISCGWKWKSNTGRFATGWFYALYLFISICCESQLFSSIKGYHVYMN